MAAEPPTIQLADQITGMMSEDDLSSLKAFLGGSPPEKWQSSLNKLGMTPLQASLHKNNKEAFDLLLPHHDLQDLEVRSMDGKSTLMYAIDFYCSWKKWRPLKEYFAFELINKGASIEFTVRNGGTYLHDAVAIKSVKISKLLLNKGIDINAQNDFGNTALHSALLITGEENEVTELVTMFLCYGADPFIENNQDFTPFHFVSKRPRTPLLCETLFLYTFDELTAWQIDLENLIFMEAKAPHLLNLCMNHQAKKVPFVRTRIGTVRSDFIKIFRFLLDGKAELLKFVLETRISEMSNLLSQLSRFHLPAGYAMEEQYGLLVREKSLTNLNLLLESGVKYNTIEFLQAFESSKIFETAICNNTKEAATKILSFFLSYDLQFDSVAYDIVYRGYGDCGLFRLLLHIGHSSDWFSNTGRNAMSTLCSDIHFDLEKAYKGDVTLTNVEQLLDHFAHSRITRLLLNQPSARMESHPKVPLLQELAREAFRQHFIAKLNITSAKEFYWLLNGLPVSFILKKIITYQTKLYT